MLKQLVIHQTGSNFSTELSSFSHIKISIAKSKTQENRKKSLFVSQNIFYKASSQLKDLRNVIYLQLDMQSELKAVFLRISLERKIKAS